MICRLIFYKFFSWQPSIGHSAVARKERSGFRVENQHQTRATERRKELQKVQEKLHGVFMESAGIWQALPAELRRSLLAIAQDCVEGRNGVLSLHQHQMRGLNPQALTALTVVHNFVTTRCDGSTAALRFFRRAPDKPLFEHLCQVLPLPAPPRKRLRRPAVDLIIASAA